MKTNAWDRITEALEQTRLDANWLCAGCFSP